MPGPKKSTRGDFRVERLSESIHQELAQRLLTEVKDPRVEPISITSVTVTRDLSRARVMYLPLGGGAPSEHLIEGLEAAGRILRGPIGRALQLRHAPEIVFVFDEHHDRAMAVNRMLDQLARERSSTEGEKE
jgi:ribosome-binding factor A